MSTRPPVLIDRHAEYAADIIVAVMCAAALALAWPDIHAWLADQPVVTAAPPVLVHCRMPTEHEQLHIVATERDGRIVAECLYLGSRGTYRRRGQ